MDFETIRVERADAVLTITLDRPDRLNACSLQMADEIRIALGDSDRVRALLLTGAGRAFCSGADLQALVVGDTSRGEATHAALTDHYNPLIRALVDLPIPVVAAVNGVAAGIGSSIALAADFVIAAESAYFLQAFVNIGLVPDGGASWFLPQLVGKARAAELMMLGERLPAATAAEWGLIHRCVADDALAGEARALATRLATMPTAALGIMRNTLHHALSGSLGDTLAREAEGQAHAADSADAAIGAAAFLTKTPPVFTGQ